MEKDQHAVPGEAVWVCVDRIRADRRDAYRRFLDEVKAPAVRAIRPWAHRSVRLLEPTAPNPDGSWSFVWLMDPAVPGEDYDAAVIFAAFYGPEKAAEHMRTWEGFTVAEQVCYETVQTDW